MESEKGKLTKNREWNVDYLEMRGGELGRCCLRAQICNQYINQKINKIWGSNV